MSELLEMGRRILASQPFSVLIGARLERFEPGVAEVSLDLNEELTQHHGFAHGGVLSYLADIALTFAGGSVLGDSLTAEYKINYVRPGTGERLVARASVLHAGKTQAVCRCDIFAVRDGEERLCSTAQGTIRKI